MTLGTSAASAASMKAFQPSESPDHPCKLAKSVGGKWIQADGKELSGQQFAATVSKANAEFSNFKYSGTWYAVKTECLVDAGGDGSSGESAPSGSSSGMKYFVELRAQKYLMMGAGSGGGPNGTAGQTNSPLTSSLGIGGRIGYYWRADRVLFVDVNTLKVAQTTTYAGSPSGTTLLSDSILMVNLGMMIPFQPSYFGLVPFAAASLGYSKLTETITGTLSPGGSITIADNASTFNAKLEGGVTYPITRHLDGVFSLAFTYMSVGTKTITESNFVSDTTEVGDKLTNAIGYSHLTAALGIRYSF